MVSMTANITNEVVEDTDGGDEAGDRPAHRAPRIHDVARLAGVSVATVSMVMNDSPRISRPTATRVRSVAERLGYRASRAARALRGMKSRTMVVFVPSCSQGMADLYIGGLLNGVREAAHQAGYRLLLEQAAHSGPDNQANRPGFDAEEVEGILCVGCTVADVPHEMLDLPLMLIDSSPSKCRIDHVTSDYTGAMTQAVKHLKELGHRQIALVRPAGVDHREFEMLVAFRQAMSDAGISQGSVLAQAERSESGGSEASADLLDRHPRITAMIAADDRMAVGILHQLSSRGLDCPKDISVISLGDLGPAAYATPGISAVSLPLSEVGRLGCERFIERLRGEIASVAERLPTHLVARASTGRANVTVSIRQDRHRQ